MESTYPLQMVKHVENWNGPSDKHFSFRNTYPPFFFPSKFLMIPIGYLPNKKGLSVGYHNEKNKNKNSADPLCNLMPKPFYAGVGGITRHIIDKALVLNP